MGHSLFCIFVVVAEVTKAEEPKKTPKAKGGKVASEYFFFIYWLVLSDILLHEFDHYVMK